MNHQHHHHWSQVHCLYCVVLYNELNWLRHCSCMWWTTFCLVEIYKMLNGDESMSISVWIYCGEKERIDQYNVRGLVCGGSHSPLSWLQNFRFGFCVLLFQRCDFDDLLCTEIERTQFVIRQRWNVAKWTGWRNTHVFRMDNGIKLIGRKSVILWRFV